MSSLLRLGRKQKNSSNPFRIGIFLFLSYVYSFGIDTINTFMHPRSSFENHTWFQTKMGKNPARWGGTYLYSLYKGVTHPGGGKYCTHSLSEIDEEVAAFFRNYCILGDPGAVSRVGRKGRTKVFKYGRKSPWVPTLTELFPKIQADAGSWLGTKNALYYCAQSANSSFWVLFVSSYTTAIVSITACLAHAPKKCTQSVNFQFDIKSPSDFKILSARKLKTLFQKYKLELTTGIHACIGHASWVNTREFLKYTTTADSHENVAWKSEFTSFQSLS